MSAEADQPPSRPFVLHFAPEQWGTVTRFKQLRHKSFQLSSRAGQALNGVEGNLHKYQTMVQLVADLVPTLKQDAEQLKAQGFTPARQSKKLAAVVEAMVVCLYSSLDCTRRVLCDVYGTLPGVPKKSTSKLFTNARAGTIDERVPAAIRTALAADSWFDDLQRLRTAVVHSDIGSCHMNGEAITYFEATPAGEPAKVHEDILGLLNAFFTRINETTGRVFAALNEGIKDVKMTIPCGFGPSGHVYERYIVASQVVDRNSGSCKSREWFDDKGARGPRCPLADNCGAYQAPTA